MLTKNHLKEISFPKKKNSSSTSSFFSFSPSCFNYLFLNMICITAKLVNNHRINRCLSTILFRNETLLTTKMFTYLLLLRSHYLLFCDHILILKNILPKTLQIISYRYIKLKQFSFPCF